MWASACVCLSTCMEHWIHTLKHCNKLHHIYLEEAFGARALMQEARRSTPASVAGRGVSIDTTQTTGRSNQRLWHQLPAGAGWFMGIKYVCWQPTTHVHPIKCLFPVLFLDLAFPPSQASTVCSSSSSSASGTENDPCNIKYWHHQLLFQDFTRSQSAVFRVNLCEQGAFRLRDLLWSDGPCLSPLLVEFWMSYSSLF